MRKATKGTLLVLTLVAGAAAVWFLAGDRLLALAGGESGQSDAAGGPRAVPVEVTGVRRDSLLVTLETTGELQARESLDVTTDVRGLVREVGFDEGERVEQGQLLVRLEAEQEQAQVQEAIARREQVALELDRARQLAEESFESEARVDELETQLEQAKAAVEIARARLNERTIEAPFAGWIGLRLVSPGTLIEPGTAVARLWSSGPMELGFDVPAGRAPELARGQTVIARADALPGGRVEGEVRVIEFAIAEATRTIALEATFDNPDGRLRPGTFVEVELVLDEHENALIVPEEALLLRGADTYVFVMGDDRTVERREVTVGERRKGEAEITEGLEGGEQVVVAGLQTITDGQKVQPLGQGGGGQQQAPGS